MEADCLYVPLLSARFSLRHLVCAFSGLVLRFELSGNYRMDYRGIAVGSCSRNQQFLLWRIDLSDDHGAEACRETRAIKNARLFFSSSRGKNSLAFHVPEMIIF